MGDLHEAVSSGDERRALEAIRDYLVHELEGNRCNSCNMSKLRTGDTAALVLRLTKVMEDIAAIPKEQGEVSRLELIRGNIGSSAPKTSARTAKSGLPGQGSGRPLGAGGSSA